MNLRDRAKLLPQVPGIYIMRDSLSNIIYVGKSKNLRNRVYSYFIKSSNRTSKIEKLVKNIKDFQYICTDTELEALLLECNFIKNIKPHYNRLMKNHERYVYVKINIEDQYPIVKLVSNIISEKSIYYGPFVSYNRTLKFVEGLNELLPLIKCNNYIKNKTSCINYHMGKCKAPCIGSITSQEYLKYINKVISFFEGDEELILSLKEIMINYSENLYFEKAKVFKVYVDIFNSIFEEYKHIRNLELNNYKQFIIIEKIYEKKLKVIIINRYKIQYSNIIDLEDMCIRDVKYYFKNLFLKFTSLNNDKEVNNIISKEFIDYVHIIFSYINMKKEDIVYSSIERQGSIYVLEEESLKWSNYIIDKLNKVL